MINPIIRLDYPDPEVIRVEDTYYMISTTMHFMPGGAILRSYNLKDWELLTYLYDILGDTPEEMLDGGNIYGKGMWAPTMRYHKGRFYILFVANNTHKTYLFTSDNIMGPWKKSYVEGFYHDASLFFDDDDRKYIIYGNKTIYLTELNDTLTAPKEGGLHRVIVEDKDHPGLGYEGTHFYKINGRYYAFFIHSLRDRWFRTEACFYSDSLEGEFTGGDVLACDMNYRGSGVAQGGIVDTPDGKWYGILFQDRGAVGRLPVLVPVKFEDGKPVFGVDGNIPEEIETTDLKPGYKYEALYSSDDFDYEPDESGKVALKKVWQWNHNPDNKLWSVTERKNALRLHSGRLCDNVLESINTLTQRTYDPYSEAVVTVDASALKEGDYAGICAFQGLFAALSVTKTGDGFKLVMHGKAPVPGARPGDDNEPVEEVFEEVLTDSPVVTLKCTFDCEKGDVVNMYYKKNDEWIHIGKKKEMQFRLDHFTGCRYGLYYYSREKTGGYADFMKFEYIV